MSYSRACVYFIYDRDGIIDEYVLYQLKCMRPFVDFLHCVINGKCSEEGRQLLDVLVDQVYIRENRGNDIGAYKAAIEYIGWEKVSSYDELILMNNTCFGPVYSLKELFQWAEGKNCDFWGLTLDTKTDWLGETGYLHYNKSKLHYQSYFLGVRKKLLQSAFFRRFMEEIPDECSYIESGCYYEYAFPGYFTDAGFQGCVYCEDYEKTDYPLLHDPVYLLEKYRMPFFKKRSFFHIYNDTLNHCAGEATSKLIKYLEDNDLYDMSMVWKNIVRTVNLADLVRAANLNRVLPKEQLICCGDDRDAMQKVGLIIHIYYEDSVEIMLPYVLNFKKFGEILFTTSKESIKNKLNKTILEHEINGRVELVNNRGRDVSALLIGGKHFIKDKELVCFVHDKKSTQIKPYGVGASWSYKLLENTIGSVNFISNVIATFRKEPFLGMAFPSAPNHSYLANSIGDAWTGNYANTQKLLEAFEIKNRIKEHTLCVAPLGTCFWFRTKALGVLFAGVGGNGWSYSDFPSEPNKNDNTLLHAIERSYAYFAQDVGYYPVYLYSDKYTEIELTSLEFNKSGATLMRAWNEALATQSANGNKIGNEQLTDQNVLTQYANVNYGIKQSLLHLALALRCRYPIFWQCLLPVRRMGQKILGIKTR